MQLIVNSLIVNVPRRRFVRRRVWLFAIAIFLLSSGATFAVLYWSPFWAQVNAAQGTVAGAAAPVLDVSAAGPAVSVAVVSRRLVPLIFPAKAKTLVEVYLARGTKPKLEPVSKFKTSADPEREVNRAREIEAQTTPASNTSVPTPPPLVAAPLQSFAIPLARPAEFSDLQRQIPPPPSIRPPANAQPGGRIASALKKLQAPAYLPPRPIKWVKPDLKLASLSGQSESADIKVKVKIDETGHVVAAHALIDGPRHDERLMAAAAAAVRQWIFEPAKAHGTNVPSEDTIVIHVAAAAQQRTGLLAGTGGNRSTN